MRRLSYALVLPLACEVSPSEIRYLPVGQNRFQVLFFFFLGGGMAMTITNKLSVTCFKDLAGCSLGY